MKMKTKFKSNKKILLESAKKDRANQLGVFPTTQNDRAQKENGNLHSQQTHTHTHSLASNTK